MLAQKPGNQTERLAELQAYPDLTHGADPSLDRLVALAARHCETPVALISLVEEDRQWFKARYGFDGDQTPLEQSVCSHAILEDGMTEIADTLSDTRTADNPLCIEMTPPLRFYAGVPLISRNGFKLGTLCVLDFRPRTLTELQRETLEVLAEQVMRQMELQRSLRNETVLRHEIDHRVKNSLQTVMSFIRLYASRTQHAETREALAAIGRRVSAIAQLHSELYQTEDYDQIRLDRYLTRVVGLLKGSTPPNVVIKTRIAPVTVDSRVAATLAMIVSECVANALKHAFPDDRAGTVEVTLEGVAPDGFVLTCRDDGVGSLTDGQVPAQADGITSIGKRLMESAAEQIGGEMTLDSAETGYTMRLVKRPMPQPTPELQADAP